MVVIVTYSYFGRPSEIEKYCNSDGSSICETGNVCLVGKYLETECVQALAYTLDVACNIIRYLSVNK